MGRQDAGDGRLLEQRGLRDDWVFMGLKEHTRNGRNLRGQSHPPDGEDVIVIYDCLREHSAVVSNCANPPRAPVSTPLLTLSTYAHTKKSPTGFLQSGTWLFGYLSFLWLLDYGAVYTEPISVTALLVESIENSQSSFQVLSSCA